MFRAVARSGEVASRYRGISIRLRKLPPSTAKRLPEPRARCRWGRTPAWQGSAWRWGFAGRRCV